jgi:hypothetical protein
MITLSNKFPQSMKNRPAHRPKRTISARCCVKNTPAFRETNAAISHFESMSYDKNPNFIAAPRQFACTTPWVLMLARRSA